MRRQNEEATPLWLVRHGSFVSKAVSPLIGFALPPHSTVCGFAERSRSPSCRPKVKRLKASGACEQVGVPRSQVCRLRLWRFEVRGLTSAATTLSFYWRGHQITLLRIGCARFFLAGKIGRDRGPFVSHCCLSLISRENHGGWPPFPLERSAALLTAHDVHSELDGLR